MGELMMEREDLTMLIGMKEDIASIRSIVSTMAKTNDIAIEALQSTQSAHHRIEDLKQEIREIRTGQRWAIGAAISAVALFVSALGFIWRTFGA